MSIALFVSVPLWAKSKNLKICLLSRIKYIFRIILLLCHSEWRRSRNWRISDNRSLSKDKTFRIVILNRYIFYYCKKWLCDTMLSVCNLCIKELFISSILKQNFFNFLSKIGGILFFLLVWITIWWWIYLNKAVIFFVCSSYILLWKKTNDSFVFRNCVIF